MSWQGNRPRHLKPFTKIIIALVVICALLLLVLLVRSLRKGLPPPSATLTTPGKPSATERTVGFPELRAKPNPANKTFRGCPPEGDGGDPALNRLKNRVDEGSYIAVGFDALKNLPWPKKVERRDRDRWSSSDLAEVERYEGTPVVVEGYLADAKLMGPESPNCHGADKEFRDYHIWLTKEAGDDRTGSIVIETTPPIRENHPSWRTDVLNKIGKAQQRVRISGWLLLDPEHPDQVGKTRGTIWEIHPIMKIEVQQNGLWKSVDEIP
ncbi:MAG TPA: hypothetical protein VGB17_13905 [Pyrinomonadaceae bacterium]